MEFTKDTCYFLQRGRNIQVFRVVEHLGDALVLMDEDDADCESTIKKVELFIDKDGTEYCYPRGNKQKLTAKDLWG